VLVESFIVIYLIIVMWRRIDFEDGYKIRRGKAFKLHSAGTPDLTSCTILLRYSIIIVIDAITASFCTHSDPSNVCVSLSDKF
jgi:hypothetical protein